MAGIQLLPLCFCLLTTWVAADVENDSSGQELDKRYIAALAKNGRLPSFARKEEDKRLEESEKTDTPLTEDKRYIAALAKNGKLPIFSKGPDEKKYVAALARDGKLPSSFKAEGMKDKKYIAALAKNNRLPVFNRNDEEKRYIAALAKNGRLPSFAKDSEDKRYLAALAKNGRLPSFAKDQEEKRYLGAWAKNGRLPYIARSRENKRYIAALAKNGRLPSFSKPAEGKRYVAALAKNGKLPKFGKKDDAFSDEEIVLPEETDSLMRELTERAEESLEKDEELPGFSENAPDKRYIAALAKNGKLPSFHPRAKRSLEAFSPLDDYPDYTEQDSEPDAIEESVEDLKPKRNIAALARMGLLRPRTRTSSLFHRDQPPYKKRQSCEEDTVPEKRYLGALARSGRLPPWHYNRVWGNNKNYGTTLYPYLRGRQSSWSKQKRCAGKRNVSMLARKGLLPH